MKRREAELHLIDINRQLSKHRARHFIKLENRAANLYFAEFHDRNPRWLRTIETGTTAKCLLASALLAIDVLPD